MPVLQATAAAQINASVLTAGDYTVYVTGLPSDVTNADLKEYGSHYGEVNTNTSALSACISQMYFLSLFCSVVLLR